MECHLCGKQVEDIKIYVEHVLYECAQAANQQRDQEIYPHSYMEHRSSSFTNQREHEPTMWLMLSF